MSFNLPLVCKQPPNVHGSKKAVLCGINYLYSRHQLKGCINDSKCMKHMLKTKFGYPEASILMLTGKWSHAKCLTLCLSGDFKCE
jgi:hypothetical protein